MMVGISKPKIPTLCFLTKTTRLGDVLVEIKILWTNGFGMEFKYHGYQFHNLRPIPHILINLFVV